MIKPKMLKKGDKVALVSLSWGGLGDPQFIHKYCIARERLKTQFGLELVPMKNALSGSEFVENNPEERARDLMDAFRDTAISGIFCAIGGDDTVRILPYIDFDVIRNNPKIFMGYSDTTANHFMMYRAGLTSFYGPSVMCEFGEYVEMPDYTSKAVKDVLFANSSGYKLLPSETWSDDFIPWVEKNINTPKKYKADEHGYEVLQGQGLVRGHLLGGCVEVLAMIIGTEIWPPKREWENAVLFLETSEEKPTPEFVRYILRNFAAQGILSVLSGILFGKPQGEVYYSEYKEVLLQVLKEEGLDLPVFYNVNFGHAFPIGILPYGIETELNCKEKTIVFAESATV